MPPTTVMIVLGARPWTMQALHLACTLARRQDLTIVLVKMLPVSHPMLLDVPAGGLSLSRQDKLDMQEYAATAEDYGVTFTVRICQYASFIHGVVDAAEQLGVTAVFADVPHHVLSLWMHLQRWRLHWQLTWHNQQLYTLEQSDGRSPQAPAILLSDQSIL